MSCSTTSTRTPSISRTLTTARGSEPRCLPARFPNLLVNGAGGIAVGMATNIPPHNLGEVIDGAIAHHRQSGDRSAGADADHSGTGFPDRRHHSRPRRHPQRLRDRPRLGHHARQVDDRADARHDREAIIITEIPYQVNKSTMIEKMAELVRDKRIEGISDIRDESDRQGYRVVIELKRDADRRRHPQPALPLHAAADLVRLQHGGAEWRQAGTC